MRKVLLLFIAVIYPVISGAQFCVNLYTGDDFDLSELYNSITIIEIDSSGNKWFGQNYDYGNGDVGRFNDTTWVKVDHSYLPDPRPEAIAFDMSDSVWVATRSGIGIIHVDSLKGRQMKYSPLGLPEAYVTAIAVDPDNNKWIGFHSGRIAKYNGTSWESFTGISTSEVTAIEVAGDGSIWVGFGGLPGLARRVVSDFNPIPGYTAVSAITADQYGRVLVASHDSLVIYSSQDTTVVKATAGNIIRDVGIGSGTGIWASSGQGLLYRREDRFLRFSSNNSSVPASLSYPIEFDKSNNLWFAFHYLSSDWRTGTGYLYRTADATQSIVTADKASMAFCYGDSLTLTADPAGVSYVWPDGTTASNTYIVRDSALEIPVAVEGANRCYFYDTLTATVQRVYEDEVICAASVDTSQKVLIIWERTPEVGTASYNIYREESTDVYQWIANVPVGELSVFVDPEADPYIRPYRYKITAVDTCQNESDKSYYHQTLHLAASKGNTEGDVNLHWVQYEGLSIANYLIFRGQDSLSMEQIATVPGNVNDYIDTDVFDTVFYKVGFILPADCAPGGDQKAGAGPYHHALSNLDKNRQNTSGVFDALSPRELNAWPNPMTSRSRIEFPNHRASPYVFNLYDAGGRLIREVNSITAGEFYIHRGQLKPGFYFFKLRGEKNYQGKILVQ